MKLTRAQQKIVDAMRDGLALCRDKQYGGWVLDSYSIRVSTAPENLRQLGVIEFSHASTRYEYYALTRNWKEQNP